MLSRPLFNSATKVADEPPVKLAATISWLSLHLITEYGGWRAMQDVECYELSLLTPSASKQQQVGSLAGLPQSKSQSPSKLCFYGSRLSFWRRGEWVSSQAAPERSLGDGTLLSTLASPSSRKRDWSWLSVVCWQRANHVCMPRLQQMSGGLPPAVNVCSSQVFIEV